MITKDGTQLINIWEWTALQKIIFRVGFIFLVLLAAPINLLWWQRLFATDWLHPNYRDVYDIARFLPDFPFLSHYSKGLKSYNDWLVIFVIAVTGGFAWTLLDKKRKEYNRLYYWLRVIVRYRAGIGMVGFGMQKVFPVQMAYPPIGILNTAVGDMTMQKLYWWEIGISPYYQVFTGFIEVGAGLLLFHRKTTFWGAALLAVALGAVNYVNIAYDGNVHVYSTYFVVFGLFLMIAYARDIYRLQIREKYTVPRPFYPSFATKAWKIARASLKILNVAIFLVLLPWLQYLNFIYDPYNQPSAKGVRGLHGLYNVTTFRINGKTLPYDPLDSVRWQQVALEKWSTLSFKINLPVPRDISDRMSDPAVRKFVNNNGFNFNSGAPVRDIDRTYEIFAANQRSFYYRADTKHHVLYLQDKATTMDEAKGYRSESNDPGNKIYRNDWIPDSAQLHIVSEIGAIPKRGRSSRRTKAYERVVPLDKYRDRMVLGYELYDGGRKVMLRGVNENNDSLVVVLDRVDKEPLLPKSSLVGGNYDEE
jgi:hypothetical protein